MSLSFLLSTILCLVVVIVVESFVSLPSIRTTTLLQMSSSSERRGGDALTSSAPIYITIGPQCCGKTTILSQLDPKLIDISLDDQPDVYVPVPIENWLNHSQWMNDDHQNCDQDQNNTTLLLQQEFHGKTIQQRMKHDNVELNLILQRWNQKLSPQTFAIYLLQYYNKQNYNVSVAHTLTAAVEEFLKGDQQHQHQQHRSQQQPQFPSHIQVFCLEALFRSNPITNQSAIQRAHGLMRQTPSHIPMAWGNTNSKPRDYQQVLEIACQTRRPVVFVLCHPHAQTEYSLPWVDLKTLLIRNLQRLAKTGKYIPAFAVQDCCQRIEQLIPPDESMNTQNTKNRTGFQVEQALVQMASPPRNHHWYRLTSQRLVQKEYPRQQKQQHRQQHHYGERYEGQYNQSRPFTPRPHNGGKKRRYYEGESESKGDNYGKRRKNYRDNY